MKKNSLILSGIALLLASCNLIDDQKKKIERIAAGEGEEMLEEIYGTNKDSTPVSKVIVLQPFTELPDAIDGCACLFAEDNKAYKEGEYLYADNMQTAGFVKIDGEMVQVTLDESENYSDTKILTTGRNEDIEIKLDLRKSDQVDYVGTYFGTLEVKTKDGRKYKKTVFGECGC